ncbi:acid--CoA ligase [Nonomuraea mesophila]|uniref:Acid--CoA ligase n=2 Tax=Nonomuraea mesophila TaxID=2530382 RepID=A0A4R5F999_9ACTN|nr:acid--CoA ligase [Nonomuraea mesophila]
MELLEANPPEPYVRSMARLADDDPDFVAIVHEDRTITRRELERQSNRLARVLRDRGVRHGDYAAIALPNGIGFFVAFWATLKVGGVPIPLSYRLPRTERQAILDLANPALLIGVDPADHPGHAALPAEFVPDASVSDEPLPEVVSPSWKAPTSGGSTGRPKLIRITAPAHGAPALNRALWGLEPTDVQAVVAPLYHNAALQFATAGQMLGQRLVVLTRFDPEQTLRAIERHRVSWMMTVPTMLQRMYRVIEAGGEYDLGSLRALWHSSAPCPPWLKAAWIDLVGADKVYEVYAGTESIATTVITGTEWLEHPGSVGRPTVGDMKIVGNDGEELPRGAVGEIYMRGLEGAGPSYEYVGAERKPRDGWDSLGDLGWMDDDGYLYITDRRADLIVAGGANIYPAEVESAIDRHPKVVSSVVVGLSDPDLGQRVHAVVHAQQGTTAEELLEFLADHLVRYKIPRSIEITGQPLRDESGKVRRSQVRDAASGRTQSRA